MSAPAPSAVPELEDELATFRREWLQEQAAKRNAPPPAVLPSSPIASSSSPPTLSAVTESLDALVLEEKWRPPRPKTAIELYELAVISEREGRLNDALSNYRAAFRLDSDVDKAYHRASLAPTSPSRAAEPLPAEPSGNFRFERTMQLTPDYQSEKEHRSVEAVERGTGKGTAGAESTHPSSTAFLLDSLLRSIAANPWERTSLGATSEPFETSPTPTLTPDEAHQQLAFIPADPERPLPIGNIPREVLLLVLRNLSLSSVLPPPNAKLVEAPPAPTRGKGKRRTLKEAMKMVEMEMGLVVEGRDIWKSDVEALERFARTCRAARVVTLDDAIWRNLCLRTYIPPHQISREENAVQIAKELHAGDWRRCYIEHPRIRLDGVFIAVVTYLRRGESHQAWCSPTHLITFYRYLRFYPTGLVVSLLTVDPPSAVVRQLNPSLRVKGLTLGRWRLRGDEVECWGLEDPAIEEGSRKYSFRMNCRLRSTARGRMNKLELRALATENRRTLELEDVPIRPTKPFFFSKVASYAGEELLD